MAENYAERRAIVEDVAKAALKDEAEHGPGRHGWCLMPDGTPVLAKHKLSPVIGSTRTGDDGASLWGSCPLCGTFAKIHSVRKVMLKHVMRREPVAASPCLSEPEVQPTDTGANTGDPAAGSQRRADAIDGAWERGTVALTVVVDGKRETQDVPATLENLRLALKQETARRKRLRSSDSIKVCDALVIKLRRMVKAAEKGKKAFQAPAQEERHGIGAHAAGIAAGQRGEARTDGVALVQGRTEPTLTHEEWQAQQTGKPGPTTLDAPVGRERPDAGALGAETGPHDSRVQRCADGQCGHIAGGVAGYLTYAEVRALPRRPNRRYWQHVKTIRERRDRERAWLAARQPVRQGTAGRAAESLTDAPSRESAELERIMRQAPGGTSERMDRIASRS